jgi:hypothetical protein
MANTTLGAIRDKVRRLTRSPSLDQLSDAQLDEYVNTFILYDFPVTLRLFSLRTTLTFYTQPYVDTYETNAIPNDPLFNFKNRFTAVHQPVYIAGVQGFYTQNRSIFYASWPQISNVADTLLRGSGVAGPYTGTLTAKPAMRNQVIFTANDANGTAMTVIDYPFNNLTGALGLPGVPQTIPSIYGQVNYVTGVYNVTFPNVVPLNSIIWSETVPYQPSKPLGMLFYDNKFSLRPIPDKAYAITIEADARPTELLAVGNIPDEEQWWQYVAIGASIKVLQDRFDMDSVNLLMTEFKRQEDMCGRASLSKYANERAKTIYSLGKNYGYGWFATSWPY